jgi:nicotinate-nucleotide adenylyltransferase
MARILLFGGSFNPVHNGHLRLAVEALEQYSFDQVWMLPSGTPPHRQAYTQAPGQRLAMLELACQSHPQLFVCEHEITGSGTNYTVDTVAQLQERWPQHRFSFLTGMDVVYDYPWRGFAELLAQLEHFLVASRPGYQFEKLLKKLAGTPHLERICWLQVPLHEVSSSMIRQRLSEARSIHFWVPEAVRVYAEEQGIYRDRGPIVESV